MKQYVIIGGGIASAGCIRGIRSIDSQSQIVLISGEGRLPYYRPLISYFLQGKTDAERMKYYPDSFYNENNCRVLYQRAEKIDADSSAVILENGERVEYCALCVATGSAPFVPPVEGLEAVKSKFSFMTQADAQALDGAVTAASRVLVVGAGLIGLKCAEGLCGRVGSITVCDLAPRVLSSILDDFCADIMQKKLEEHGVGFMLSDSVLRFDGDRAYMKSGKTLDFDILVMAVGVRPNISLVKELGGRCHRAIGVDAGMKTSLEGIFAAGDCTQSLDASDGQERVMAILPNAFIQGQCAGVNMAGGAESCQSLIPMNAIGFFGLHALTAGSYSGDMYEEKTQDTVKRLFVRDGLLRGFILIGDVAGAGIYTAMIRNKLPLAEVDFAQLKKEPSLAAFSAQYRRNKLSEVV